MKKLFIIKVLIFLFVFSVASLLLNEFYNEYLKRENIDDIKDKQFQQYRKQIRFLFMGDSHFMNGIDTREIEKSFNYGSGQENYIHTYYKFKYLIYKEKFVPEYLILPFDPSSFSSFRISRIGVEKYWTKYLDFSELSFRLQNKSLFFGEIIGNYFGYAGKYHVFIKRLINCRKRELNDLVFLGYMPRFESLADSPDIEKACRDRAAIYFKGWTALDENLKDYFSQILELAEKNRIKVILVKMPLSGKYLDYVSEYTSIDSNNKVIEKIVKNYQNVDTILDFQNIFRENDDFFQNPDHLNSIGAKKLSELLNDELNDN